MTDIEAGNGLKRLRLLLWLLVAFAAAGFAWLALKPPQAPEQSQAPAMSFTLGGPFTLTGADGKRFSSASLAGTPYAVFFGFTHCPDVCPTTLARLVKLRRQTGGPKPFEILFITVDPERDGPQEVGKYAKLFAEPVIGLTGSPAEITQVKKQFGIFSEKVPDKSGGYSVDHSAAVLLFGRDGKFVATVAPDEPDAVALAKLERIAS